MERLETIESCAGYRALLGAVTRDEERSPGFHDYRGKLKWVIERAQHYSDKTGIGADAILDAWERDRKYWYMNYYQDANQPRLDGARVRVFETTEDAQDAIGSGGFRCPRCNGASKNPYRCASGMLVDGKVCDWTVGGLFRDLGKGVYVYVKSEVRGDLIFMPIAWESNDPEAAR